MIKALWLQGAEKPIQADLKKSKHCEETRGNAMDINRQLLKCHWASEVAERLNRAEVSVLGVKSLESLLCSLSILHVAASLSTMPQPQLKFPH